MPFLFFSKTNKNPRKKFFNPKDDGYAEDAEANSGQERATGQSIPTPASMNNLSYEKLRFLKSRDTLDDILERLLRNAESSNSSEVYLEVMLTFLKKNPELVNQHPINFIATH